MLDNSSKFCVLCLGGRFVDSWIFGRGVVWNEQYGQATGVVIVSDDCDPNEVRGKNLEDIIASECSDIETFQKQYPSIVRCTQIEVLPYDKLEAVFVDVTIITFLEYTT